ncbi:MAG: GAF domain-containing protein, partial [Deltaproteobacteria bacterium]|nr:GAF domain-containing protein [Deltaproteobacteria bacterium]
MAKQLKRDRARITRGKMASGQEKSEKLEVRYHELQILQEISQAVLTSQDIQTILGRILDRALLVGPFDLGVIRLLDASSKVLMPAAHRGYRDLANLHGKTTDPKDEATGMILVKVMAAKGSYQIDDVPSSQGMRSFKKEGVRSAIVVPVRAGEEILGDIQLGSRTPRRLRPNIVHLLESIGSQMGLAVQKARLFEKISAKSRELDGLSAITKQITQIQESDRLLAMILEETSRLLRAEGVGIRVVAGDELRLLARTEAAKEVMIQPSIKVGESLSGRVALESDPIAVYDLTSDSRHIPEHNRPAIAAGFRSFLGVPLRLHDKVIGTLSILTKEHRHFSQEEMDLVSAFADQAAVAIQNTRLFEDSNRRREQAEALREIGLSLTATHNPQQVLDQVAEEARRLVGALFTFVTVPDKPFYRFVAVAGDDQGYRHVLKLSDDPASPYGQGPLGRAIRSRKSVVCEDVLSDPLFVTWREIASERGIRSLVAVPLLVQEKSYGAILVYSPIPRAYEAGTLNLLELLAAQAGAALENARLYQASQQQQEVERLLKELSQDITSLDIDSLLKKLTQKVREFFKVDVSDVRILEDGRWQVMGVSGTDPERVQSDSTGTARGRSKWILQNRKPLLIPDITEGERFSGGESIRKAGIRGYLAVPLFLRNGEVIGILRALTYEPREFSQSEVDLLQQLANGAAIALENARLYEETERRRREGEELARVAQSLTETLDVTAIAERVVTSVRDILDVKTSTLRLLQPDGSLRALASRGEGSPRSPGGGQTVPSGMGLTSRAIAEGRPVWSADMLNDPKVHLTDQMRDSQLRSGNSSMIAVPLRAREKIIGALALSDQKGRIYSDREVALVQTFADQAALALENARLFEETGHRAREQAALNAIATATSQSLRIDDMLRIALDKVLEVTGREQGYVRLTDLVTGNVTLAAHRGISQKYVETLLHQRTPGGKSDQVFESGEPLIINDPEGSLLKEQTRREGSRSMSWFPLKVRGRTVGIMNISTTRPIPFQPREVELLKAIGNIIGVAIENARLFEQTQRNLERVRALHEIGLATTSTFDLHSVLDVLMEKIDVFLTYTAVLVWLLNRETGQLERTACRNLDEKEWKGRKLKGTSRFVQTAVETKAPVVVRNIQTDPRALDPEFYRRYELVSYLGMPLLAKGEVLGVLVFLTREEHEFSRNEIEFLSTLAGQAAVAIHNSQLYEQIKNQAVELERANKAQADFTAMIAHDLRSPLMNVTGAAGMIHDGLFGPVNEDQKKWLLKIQAYSHSLVGLVNDFLDLSKLEAGGLDLARGELDLGTVIHDSVDGFLALARNKKIILTADVAPGLPRIDGDPNRLGQVLTNLLSNAIKFTGEGGRVEIGVIPQGGELVKIQIRDTGVGIAREEVGTLFEKYRQTSSGKVSK